MGDGGGGYNGVGVRTGGRGASQRSGVRTGG